MHLLRSIGLIKQEIESHENFGLTCEEQYYVTFETQGINIIVKRNNGV